MIRKEEVTSERSNVNINVNNLIPKITYRSVTQKLVCENLDVVNQIKENLHVKEIL